MDEAFERLLIELKNPTSENELLVRYGTAARTLDTYREEKGLKAPQTPWDDLSMCVSLIRQIRNVFAHNTIEPKWDIRERYRLLYEFDDVSISLIDKHGLNFDFEHVGSCESIFALRIALECRI